MGILFFVSVLGYAIGARKLFPKMRPGVALLTSVCSMVFLSYLTVILFGLYRFGAYSVILLGFAAGLTGIGLDIYENIKMRKSLTELLTEWKKDYLTPSMVMFLIITLGSAFFIRGMQAFPSHDNYSFWGRAVREMWMFDSSYINAASNIAHNDYCSAITALQYSVVRVFGWKNEYLCYVPTALVAAAYSAIYDRFTWKNKWYAAFAAAACFALYPMASNTFDFDELLIDGPLAILFASALLLWAQREDDSFASLLPVAAAAFVLVTAKLYIGLMLAVVLLAAVFIHWIKNRSAMHYAGVLTMALLIMFAQFSWSAHYNYMSAIREYEVAQAQSEYLDVDGEHGERPGFSLSYVFKGNPRNSTLTGGIDKEEIHRNLSAAKPYFLKVFTEKLNGSTSPQITTFSLSMLTIIALAVTAYLASDKLRRNMLYSCLLMGIALFLYMAGMLVTILVVQPVAMTSIIRYIGIAMLIMQNVLFCYLAHVLSENNKTARGFAIGIAVFLILFVSPEQLYHTYCLEERYFSDEFARSGIESAADRIDEGDRVLYVDNRDPKGGYLGGSGFVYCYQYCAFPNYANAVFHPYGSTDDLDTIDMGWLTKQLTGQRADKLVIMTDDDAYRQRYADILGINPSAEQPWVFSVDVADGVFSITAFETVSPTDVLPVVEAAHAE